MFIFSSRNKIVHLKSISKDKIYYHVIYSLDVQHVKPEFKTNKDSTRLLSPQSNKTRAHRSYITTPQEVFTTHPVTGSV